MKKLIAVLTALGILTTGIYMPNNYDSALVSITANAETSAEDFEFYCRFGLVYSLLPSNSVFFPNLPRFFRYEFGKQRRIGDSV